MKIRVLPRIFFEKVKGTPTEVELLEKAKIISINSSWGFDDTPPMMKILPKTTDKSCPTPS